MAHEDFCSNKNKLKSVDLYALCKLHIIWLHTIRLCDTLSKTTTCSTTPTIVPQKIRMYIQAHLSLSLACMPTAYKCLEDFFPCLLLLVYIHVH